MLNQQRCVVTDGRFQNILFGLMLLTSIHFPLAAAFGEDGSPPKVTFEEQEAFLLSNGTLELTVLPRGSTFARVVLADDPEKLSPLWDPVRMAREAGEKPEPDSAQGHFICVDGFGAVSPQEKAAGLPFHGEAHGSVFAVRVYGKNSGTTTLTLSAKLPITQEIFTRTVEMVAGENVVYVESKLQSLLGFDRPAFWAEHATISPPFLEPAVTVVDMSAQRGKTRPYDDDNGGLPHRMPSGKDFTWPEAPGVNTPTVNLRETPREWHSLDHSTCLMDASRQWVFVTMLNPQKRLLLGYLFKPQEYPWTQNWEDYPPNKQAAHGLEFSTQPFDVPRREVVELHSLFGAAVYRWLPALTTIESHFLMFYTHTPEGMRGVDDVKFENGKIIIQDRKANKQVTLAASLQAAWQR